MARIRTIKPEFFDSPSTAACSPWARLLYIAMWCLADDWGVGPANMKELAAFAFPNDDEWTSKELPSLCKEVADNFGALFYTHSGRPYYAIPTWDDHQVTQRRAKRRHPTPDDPESLPMQGIHDTQGSSLSMQGSSEPTQGNGKYGTGEQGNRGTGEKDTLTDDVGEGDPTPIDEYDFTGFREFWDAYPRKVDKKPALKAYRAAVKRSDRDTIQAGALAYAGHVATAPADKIKHAATWLNNDCWENDYATETPTGGENYVEGTYSPSWFSR